MKRRFLTTTALTGLALAAYTQPAFALCNDNAPATDGVTVTCISVGGVDALGVQAGARSNITVNMTNSGEINTGNGVAILLGSNGAVTMDNATRVDTNNADSIQMGSGTINSVGGSIVSAGGTAITINGAGTVTLGAGSTVSGGVDGIRFIASGGTAANVTVGGLLTAGANAIDFSDRTATLTLNNGYNITGGNITAKAGAGDSFILGGAANSSFDTTAIDNTITGFDTFTKAGTSTWVLSGSVAKDWTINAGTLEGTVNNLDNVTVNAGGVLQFTTGGTFSDDITGAGGFTKNGGATLILDGTNNFTGATNVLNSTTMQIANAAALSATSSITVNQSAFQFGSSFTYDRNFTIGTNDATFDTQANNVTLTGNIDGVLGRLIKSGTGTLTLAGTNTYGDGTTVDQGFLVGTTNSLQGAITSNSTLVFDQSFTGTYISVLDGTGGLTKRGTGTVTLSNTSNNYAGITRIEGGTLIVSNTGSLGNGGGGNNIQLAGGTLQLLASSFTINRSLEMVSASTINTAGNDFGILGNMTGSGDLTKAGAGVLSLGGNNTYTGNFIVNAGALGANSNAALGNAANIIQLNSAGFQFNAGFNNTHAVAMTGSGNSINTNGFNGEISGIISGASGLNKTGTGTLTLSAANTYSGVTSIAGGGAISVGAANNLGDGSAGNDLVLNNGSLTYSAGFNQTRDVTLNGTGGAFNTGGFNAGITGNVTGTGALQKNQGGTLTITGAHTYTGNTIINLGTLELNYTSDRSYNGDISGVGAFVKSGSGNLTLTGASSLTGTMNVNGGTVTVNGSVGAANAININNGATLGGSGTIVNANVNSGGRLAADTTGATLNVTNDVTFNNGSILRVAVDANGQTGLVDVGGAATINGGSVYMQAGTGSFTAGTIYTILQATGGVTGTFGSISSNMAFLNPQLIYNANNIQIELTASGNSFGSAARDDQQAEVAQAITNLGTGNAVYDAYQTLSTDQAAAALDDLGGEHNAGVAGAMIDTVSAVRNHLFTHMNNLTHANASGDRYALAPVVQDPSIYTAALLEPGDVNQEIQLWLSMIGSHGKSDAHGMTPEQDRRSFGGLAGMDIPYDDAGHYGFYAGYESGNIDTDSQNASSNLDNYHLGAYATRPLTADITISGGFGATYHTIDTQRYVSFGAVTGTPSGDTNGQTYSAFAQIARAMQNEHFAYEPFASFSLTHSRMNGYTETGGNGADLTVGDADATVPSTVLGMRFGKSVTTGDSEIGLNASLGWQHNFGDLSNSATMRFATGTTTFNSAGPPRDRNAAVISLGADAKIASGTRAFAGYNGTLSADNQDHGFTAGVKINF